MIINLLTEAFFGALTGYITNDVAIKTLFKPNGIIEKNREQFTKEIAALLEDKIITADDLAQIIRRDEVTEEITQEIELFLGEILPQNLRDKSLNDLANVLKGEIEQLMGKLCADEQFKAAVDEGIGSFISPEIANSVLDIVKKSLLEAVSADSFSFNEEAIVLDRDFVEQLKRELERMTSKFVQNISTDAPQIINDALLALDIDAVCKHAWEKIGVHSIADYLGFDPDDGQSIKMWLSSPMANSIMLPIWEELWRNLADSQLYVHEIASLPPLKNMLMGFLAQQWPEVSYLLVEWISQNKAILMSMLDQSIIDVLNGQDTLVGMLSKIVHDFLGDEEKFSAEFCQSAQEFLLTNFTPDQLSELLLAQGTPLGDLKLADIAAKIPPAKGQEFLIMVVAELLVQNSRINGWLKTPLAQLCPLSAEDIALKAQEIISEKCTFANLEQQLSLGLAKIAGKLAEEKLAEIRPGYAQETEKLAKKIVDGITIDDVSPKITQMAAEYILANLVTWANDLLEKPLAEIYALILPPESVPKISPKLTEYVQSWLIAQIPGKLAPLAEKSLNTLSNDDLRQLVQDFMGRELKPLNYLGAMMGGATGAVLGTAVGMTMIDPFNVAYIGGKLALFGAVGYTTNCGAVKGLFWPYKPLGNIHALQGVIPKRQAAFANSLGELFDKYVLNPEMLGHILALEREKLQSTIQDMLNHQTKEIKLNITNLEPFLAQRTVNYCVDHTLADILEKVKMDSISPATLAEYTPQVLATQISAKKNIIAGKGLVKIANQIEGYSLQDFLAPTIANFSIKITEKAAQVDLFNLSEKIAAEWVMVSAKSPADFWPGGEKVLKSYLSKFMPIFIDWLCGYLKQHLEAITVFVQQLIKSRLNMFQALGYAAMNGDVLVGMVLENFITQKLPLFCGLKTAELEKLLGDYGHSFWAKSFADNGLHLDKDLIYLLLSAKVWQNIYSEISTTLSGKIAALKLSDLKNLPYLKDILADLRQEIVLKVPLLGDILADIGVKALLQIDYKEVWQALKLDDAFEGELAEKFAFLQTVLQEKMADRAITQIIPILGDKDSTLELYKRIFQAEQVSEYLTAHKEHISVLGRDCLALIIPAGSAILIEAFNNSAIYAPILEKMNLAEFITAQTVALEPQELEKMVRGFGQSYFTHIQNMGWWGAVFAIPGILLDLFV